MNRITGLLLGLMLSGAGLSAQEMMPNALPAAPLVSKTKAGLRLVLGKPYSYTQEFDREQTTPDGKKLTLHETSLCWRDSAGRARREVRNDKDKVVRSYLNDAAAQVVYRWTSEQKVAYVTHYGVPVVAQEANHPLQQGEVRNIATTINGRRVEGTYSLLPSEPIEGVVITGTRLVYYSDALRDIIYYTRDLWLLPDYFVPMREEITDNQYGHRVWQAHGFKAGEPKAEFLQVPKGYTVKESEPAESEQFE